MHPLSVSLGDDKRRHAACSMQGLMGLLKLLTFPVSGPVAGGRWVMQTLLDEAQRQYYDTNVIRQKLAEAEQQFLNGQIDEQTFDQLEDELFQRLIEARDYHQSRQGRSE